MKRLDKIIRSVQALDAPSGHPRPGTAASPASALGCPRRRLAPRHAHVGVLKVLEEENIHCAAIAGTSVKHPSELAYCSGIPPPNSNK